MNEFLLQRFQGLIWDCENHRKKWLVKAVLLGEVCPWRTYHFTEGRKSMRTEARIHRGSLFHPLVHCKSLFFKSYFIDALIYPDLLCLRMYLNWHIIIFESYCTFLDFSLNVSKPKVEIWCSYVFSLRSSFKILQRIVGTFRTTPPKLLVWDCKI